MNGIIEEATARLYDHDGHERFHTHLADPVAAYGLARRQKN